jgi:hypothetical protein
MAKRDGKTAIVEEIVAAAGAAAPAVEQLELMPPTRSLTAKEQERVETAIKRDRAGRPPGAQNKATREMLDFVRKLMGDPLERRFRWAMHTPETLSIVLGCTKLEAFDRLDRMWSELSKYFYAQLAQVDGKGNAVAPTLNMIIGGQPAQIQSDGSIRPPWLYIEETQQNQALLASPNDVSHDDVSHSEDNTSDISALRP